MGLLGKTAKAGSGLLDELIKLLAKGKADGSVVEYPDELIESTPFELRKAIADHNESILGPEYRESFGEKTFYRGGGSERSALKDDVWMSSDPYQASTYAGKVGGNVMPLKVRKEGIPEVYSNSPEWNRIGLLDSSMKIPSNEYPEELGRVMFSSEQSPYAVTDTNRIAQFAKDEGFGGVGIKGLQDIGPYQRGSDLSKVRRAESLVLADGSNARSVNAAFDPAKEGSRNLLASRPEAAIASLLGLAAMSSSDDADAGVVSKSLASITKAAEKQGVKLDIFESKKGLELSKIVVPEKSKGVGTSIMNDLADYADQTGQTVSLSPSTDFGGTSKKRLSEFYKRFGFVQNKGKNKDFTISNSMYRSPSSVTKAVAPVGTGLLGLGAAAQSNDTYADYSPSNLARLQSDDVGSIEAPQSMTASDIAGLMGSVNKVGYDDPLLGMVASQLPSELMNKIAYNDRRGLLDYAKAYAGLLGF